jgi:glycosyltransferase involved in cell wall biosynthesis
MLFTIITGCFNSSQTLRRTYESLVTQTNKDFEWIVVDDCSTDGGLTANMISALAHEAPFPVKTHFFTENHMGSKTVALACELAEGRYACILDHDDELVPHALEMVKTYIEKYSDVAQIAGICGRCVNEKGNLIGRPFKNPVQVGTECDIRFKQRITSELFQFTRIELMRPLWKTMKPGYSNGFVWARITENFKYVYINDVLRIYDTALPTSVSNSKTLRFTHLDGKSEVLLKMLESYSGYLLFNPIFAIKLAANRIRYKFWMGKRNGISDSNKLGINILFVVSIPFAYFLLGRELLRKIVSAKLPAKLQ